MVDIIEGYETEEQQVDAIKQWWKDNGNTLVIGAVVGLAGLWGWRFYNDSVVEGQEKASQAYSDMLVQFEAQGADADTTNVQAFIDGNSSSNYAVLASLLLAKEAVAKQDFELAKTQLTQLQDQNKYAPLNPLINLRLARVEVELGEYAQALTTLTMITEEGFIAKAEQVKGTVYLKQGDTNNARVAFQSAIDASNGRIDPILQLQFDDLALAAQNEATEPVLDVN
ncbi:membrane protein [Psychromonas marina]|uniref:Ancillary SecYEG translocon subunit n=1 Tax=Psychromonas marina TaxID=88364 RepID=A0ABQ6DY30_9GAMM|nr:tetratricopeptide repeat protein [Psychromonas marina]GLS89773.1 membrane protein [Psychromonas marina]